MRDDEGLCSPIGRRLGEKGACIGTPVGWQGLHGIGLRGRRYGVLFTIPGIGLTGYVKEKAKTFTYPRNV